MRENQNIDRINFAPNRGLKPEELDSVSGGTTFWGVIHSYDQQGIGAIAAEVATSPSGTFWDRVAGG
jgi:hypothetical protein